MVKVHHRYFSSTPKGFNTDLSVEFQDNSLVEKLDVTLVNNHYGINISSILDSNKCIKDKEMEIEHFLIHEIHRSFFV
jgi:hypothetical protein